jgi:glycosyltransferase involved in cell wall biosynthesis
MKVLHAITRLDRGGSSENTLLSAIGLAEKGYKVDLLFGETQSPSISLLEKARKAGVNFIEEEDLIRNIHPVRDLIAFRDIFRFIRDKGYDIVHAHSSKAGLICRLAAKLAGTKKIIYTPHGNVFYGYFGKIFNRIIVFVEALTYYITDSMVGLTPAECEEWVRFGIGRKEKYVAIPSGIDFDALKGSEIEARDMREEFGISSEGILVGSIGRFVEVKGFEYFIEAAIKLSKKRNDIYFALAGDGPLRQKYMEMISSAGIKDRFHIIGWQEKTSALFKALDLFVLPSLNEGMGRVLVEAMFFEKPAIATRVGGVPSVVSGGCGILVDPASSSAIEEAIETLADDPEEAQAMARRGREKALAEYSAEKMVNDLDMLYKKLTKET